MGCEEDGREEGGTGDEEAQGTTIISGDKTFSSPSPALNC